MGVKVQYNPSTGKVSYNPATGKVQVVVIPDPVGCSPCGGEAISAKLTFSGVTSKDGCSICGIPDRDRTWSNVPNLNREFIIPPATFQSCQWSLREDVSTTLQKYSSTDGSCTGLLSTTSYAYMEIVVTVSFSPSHRAIVTVNLRTSEDATDESGMFRSGLAGYVPDDACIDTTGVDNSIISDFCVAAYDGSIVVEGLS